MKRGTRSLLEILTEETVLQVLSASTWEGWERCPPPMDINSPTEPACRHIPPSCRLHPSDWQRHRRIPPFPLAVANSNPNGESLSFQIPCPPLQALGEAASLRVAERLPAAKANRNSSTKDPSSQGYAWQAQALQTRL